MINVPHPMVSSRRPFALLAVMLAAVPQVHAMNCSTFNPKSITAVTFDVFAALMSTATSLSSSIDTLIPSLNASQTEAFLGDWFDAYGNAFGKTFTLEETNGLEPFQYVIRTSLIEILVRLSQHELTRNR